MRKLGRSLNRLKRVGPGVQRNSHGEPRPDRVRGIQFRKQLRANRSERCLTAQRWRVWWSRRNRVEASIDGLGRGLKICLHRLEGPRVVRKHNGRRQICHVALQDVGNIRVLLPIDQSGSKQGTVRRCRRCRIVRASRRYRRWRRGHWWRDHHRGLNLPSLR